jgi:hypothetical protein
MTERFLNPETPVPKRLIGHFDALKKASIKGDEQLMAEELIELIYCIPHEDDRRQLDLSKNPHPIRRINGIINGLKEIENRPNFQRLDSKIKRHLEQVITIAKGRLNTMIALEMSQF